MSSAGIRRRLAQIKDIEETRLSPPRRAGGNLEDGGNLRDESNRHVKILELYWLKPEPGGV